MRKTGSVLALGAYDLKMEAPGSSETHLHVRIKSKKRHYYKNVTSANKLSCHKFTRDVTELIKRSSRLAFFGKTLNVFRVSPLRKGNYRDLTKYVQNFGHKISEEKRIIGRTWCGWEDNIESDLKGGRSLWFRTRISGGHVLKWQCKLLLTQITVNLLNN